MTDATTPQKTDDERVRLDRYLNLIERERESRPSEAMLADEIKRLRNTIAIAPECDFCGDELTEPGGLLFSPPDVDGRVEKQHVCVDCYGRIVHADERPRAATSGGDEGS